MTRSLFLALVLSVCLCSQYKVTSASQTTSSYTLVLSYTGNDTYYVKPTSPIIKELVFTINCLTNTDLTFKITDRNRTRFEVPQKGVFPIDPVGNFTFPINNSLFIFSYNANPFDFSLIRKFDNEVLFDTSKGNIIFSDHYLEISTPVTSKIVYGFGERFSDHFAIHPGQYTIFNRDRGQVIDSSNGQQTYGYYPAYLIREQAGNFHFNYLRSSNALDVIVSNLTSTQYLFTYKVIGGVLDFRFFLGEKNIEATIEKFQFYSGRSAIPPFWSLGFHQCRWGYKNVTYLENVISGYENNDIPLDTIWTDIDYMIDYEDFTIDETRFPLDRMAKITDKYRYVPIIDAGIKTTGKAFDEGLKQNVFLKSAEGNTYVGKVWPGATSFVDFFTQNSSSYWSAMLDNLYSKVKFSGIWLDMNEVANFCDGPCEDQPQNKSGFDYSKDLPYQPGSDGIESHTISLNATHFGNISEANLHPYFGFLESEATYYFLLSKQVRPFILTRSSTLGSNKYTFHWTGDNYAHFDYLKTSIANNFMFQFWGIHMVGADICGFGGNTNEELCSRWFQLGSFYPFARNHNDLNGISQEAYALGPVVMAAARNNLKLRYSLLKFYYRHFINKRGLGTIFRPLFIDFSNDIRTFSEEVSETQFIIGTELMFAPVVTPNVTYRAVYFPQQANWYDYFTGRMYTGGDTVAVQNQLSDPIPLFIRAGTGVASQKTANVTKTTHLDNQFILKAGLQYNGGNSTATMKRYQATIGLLSIQDFHNETKVGMCIAEGCEYTIVPILTLTSSGGKSVELDVFYLGGRGLNEAQVVTGIELFYEGGKVSQTLISPITITGPGKIPVPLTGETSTHHYTYHLTSE